jgi:penicillin-binding protein 2
VVGPEAIDAVRRGMRAAVTQGSARSLADLPVAVAAKTGTAQWSSKHPPHAWFTSFAPYDDPEIVVTVVIEEGGEGSQVAAPVARRIYESYFARSIP